ncbi:MAG: CPBP family glutamic-type intramembrane protease, partial [Patescibacteria group bacterium]
QWLSEDAQGWKALAGYIFLAALICLSLQLVVGTALQNWGYLPYEETHGSPFARLNGFELFEMWALWPVMEELLFRVLPLSILIAFISRNPKIVFGVMLSFAVLFAAIHPYEMYGKIQVGITGSLLGLLLLKCGGLSRKFMKAAVCSMAAHSLVNVFLVLYLYWKYLEFKT